MREVWKESYRDTRKSAREIAKEEFIKHPDIQTVVVPFFMPVEASEINRVAFEPTGNGEYYEHILDENGKSIRRRHSSKQMGILEIKR